MSLLRFFYTLLLTVLWPAALLLLWLKGRKNPAWRQRLSERLGWIQAPVRPQSVWIHAASVGEVLALVPLVRAFERQYPQVPLYITTFTPTGSEQVKRLFPQHGHSYLPLDLPWFMQLFIRRLRPSVLVIIERELWPNMLAQCHKRGIPMLLANARMSEKSARSYQRLPSLVATMFQQLTLVAVQDKQDGQRYLDLGLNEQKLEVTGSMKFDVEIDAQVRPQGLALREQWGSERPVLALASSHADEDERLLALLPQLLQQLPDLVLLLVPRHPERFEAVYQAARQAGFITQRRSQGVASKQTQVYLADTLGEMLRLLAASDLVLMGGSLITRGGHNPIEPAALGKAVLIGPHYFNFTDIVQRLERAGALQVVSEQQELLLQTLLRLLQDSNKRVLMGQAGLAVVKQNRGAVKSLVEHSLALGKHL